MNGPNRVEKGLQFLGSWSKNEAVVEYLEVSQGLRRKLTGSHNRASARKPAGIDLSAPNPSKPEA